MTPEIPSVLESPDFSKLVEAVIATVRTCDSEGRWDDDAFALIAEEALMAVYGPDYFDWHNSRFE